MLMPLDVLASFLVPSASNPIWIALVIALIRTIAGWLENALADGKITMYEWRKLVETVLRIVPQAIGLSAVGFDPVFALFSDIIITKFFSAVGKVKNK